MSVRQLVQEPQRQRTDIVRVESGESPLIERNVDWHVVWISPTTGVKKNKLTSGNIVDLDKKTFLESNSKTLWEVDLIQNQLGEGANMLIKLDFSSGKGYIFKGFSIEDKGLLPQIERALGFLHNKTQLLSEGLFYYIRPVAQNRPPGFVIDGWIVIQEYNRKLEIKIYQKLCNVIRNNPNLLFNIRIIARKGKRTDELIPKNYKCYAPWLDYVC